MAGQFEAPSVVVGIDGSRFAEQAARWAVAEAVSRDLPLHLIAAAETPRAAGAAEAALSSAASAVASAGRPAGLHTAAIVGEPAPVLLEASRRAEMICVGAVGLGHDDRARVGSTAAALVASAHCPVAVVRGGGRPARADPGWVVVGIDQNPDSAALLQYAVAEARMRKAPLRVLGVWHAGDHGAAAVAEAARTVRSQLDRNLENWRRRYPDLDVVPVAVHGSGLSYLAENAGAIQLAVVGARDGAAGELLGPGGLAALHGSECTVLVVDRQRLL